MHAQRQFAVAAVRAEVKRHDVAKQALSCLRTLADRVFDPELRDSILDSLNSLQGKREGLSPNLGVSATSRGIEGFARSCMISQSATSLSPKWS